MTIKFLCVGKIKEAVLQEAITEYLKRLRHYTTVEYREVNAEKRKKTENDALIRRRECERLRKIIPLQDAIIALDEHGKSYSSVEFSQFLAHYQQRGEVKALTFVIGGATGFAEEFLQEAQDVVSLSRMTFPHQLCRLILVEQVYRAYTLLAGESYHKM